MLGHAHDPGGQKVHMVLVSLSYVHAGKTREETTGAYLRDR